MTTSADNGAAAPARERVLVVRMRPLAAAAGARLQLEVEALVDYTGLYEAAPLELDLNALNGLWSADDNAYGKQLGSALLACPPVAQAWREAGGADRLRVQMLLDPVPGAHHRIRWERMEWDGLRLSARQASPFSRFATFGRAERPTPVIDALGLLLVVANPPGLAEVDVYAESLNVVEGLTDLLESGQVRLTLLCGRTILSDQQQATLRRPGVTLAAGLSGPRRVRELLTGQHALHMIAHGIHDAASGVFTLQLENDLSGALEPVPDCDILDTWSLADQHLVLLQSCQSADRRNNRDVHPFAGFAARLARSGVPAVVAMQDRILMPDAQAFSSAFYRALLHGAAVDEAANAGRSRLLRRSDSEWSIPALYLSLAGGRLFRSSQVYAAQQAALQRIRAERLLALPLFPIDVLAVRAGELAAGAAAAERSADPLESFNGLAGSRQGLERALERVVDDPVGCREVLLLGPRGRAKSTSLTWLFRREVLRYRQAEQGLAPVRLRLRDCARPYLEAERVVAEAVALWCAEETGAPADWRDIEQRIARHERFLFIVEGSDDIGDEALRSALGRLRRFMESHPEHQFVISLDSNTARLGDCTAGSECLLIQPMAEDRLRLYLTAADDGRARVPGGPELYAQLRASGLFDLAAVPWLLAELLEASRRGTLKPSRAAIFTAVTDERLAHLGALAGRGAEALQRMAWEVQRQRRRALSGAVVSRILGETRGGWDYSLVEFRQRLIKDAGLLVGSGADGVRFAYTGFRTFAAACYLLALPAGERRRELEDITAVLGRDARARWWEEPLILLSGLWDSDEVLRMILSGSLLEEGSQILLAARCLHEARQAFGDSARAYSMARPVLTTLIAQSHPDSLRPVTTRLRAIEALGLCRRPEAAAHLVALAADRVRARLGVADERQYDLSGVRLAALKALLTLSGGAVDSAGREALFAGQPALRRVSTAWHECDAAGLVDMLASGDEQTASLAAFALALGEFPGSGQALAQAYCRQTEPDSDLLWALADAMLELDPVWLREQVDSDLGSAERAETNLYLLGRLHLKSLTAAEAAFLAGPLDGGETELRARALDTLGELALTAEDLPPGASPQLVAASIREFCHGVLRQAWPAPWPESADEQADLEYHALQALRGVGDIESLGLIAESSSRLGRRASEKLPPLLLEQLRREVYEAVYWRLAGGLNREVMIRLQPEPRD